MKDLNNRAVTELDPLCSQSPLVYPFSSLPSGVQSDKLSSLYSWPRHSQGKTENSSSKLRKTDRKQFICQTEELRTCLAAGNKSLLFQVNFPFSLPLHHSLSLILITFNIWSSRKYSARPALIPLQI